MAQLSIRKPSIRSHVPPRGQPWRLATLLFLPVAALAQEKIWPGAYRDSVFVQEHFSNQVLHRQLKNDFENLHHQLQQVVAPLEAYPESKKLESFQWSKYPWRLTEKQIEEFKKSGRVKLREFGWPMLKEALAGRKRWLEILKNQIEAFVNQSAPDTTTATHPELQRLNREKQRLSDAIKKELYYVERTLKWDDYCRKGPWLLDPSLRKDLQKQIAALRHIAEKATLEQYFETIRKDSILAALVRQNHLVDSLPNAQQLRDRFRALLRDKEKIYHHYYKFHKAKHGIAVMQSVGEIVLKISLELHGPGADDEIKTRIKDAAESRLTATYQGRPLRTHLKIKLRGEQEEPDKHAIAIKIGAPGESVPTESSYFHYEIEPSTIVHEIKHLIGFGESYRDIYDPDKRIYVTYIENISKHLEPEQEIELPDLSEGEIAQILENYR